MNLADIVLITLTITPSGALSPGPLTTATIALGTKSSWKAGIKVALGHNIVEFPYIIVLCLAFKKVQRVLEGAMGSLLLVAATLVIVYFALLLLRDAIEGIGIREANPKVMKGPILIGMALTGLNVYFLIWWVSIGFKLISDAVRLGVVGIFVMYVSHVWMDYAWLALMAEAGAKAKSILSSRGYRIFLAILGILLILFGINMLTTRFLNAKVLPF
ncbi:MAG: LysE family transporter [Thermoprotei archaeon]|nr:LysE family transporter [Thermoprotei archaeon]